MNEQYGTLDRLSLPSMACLKVRHVTPADVVLDEDPPIYGLPCRRTWMRPNNCAALIVFSANLMLRHWATAEIRCQARYR